MRECHLTSNVVVSIRSGDNLIKYLATFCQNIAWHYWCLQSVSLQKESYVHWFFHNYYSNLQRNLRKYRKNGNNSEKKTIFLKFQKNFWGRSILVTWGIKCLNLKVLGWAVWLESQSHTHTAHTPELG